MEDLASLNTSSKSLTNATTRSPEVNVFRHSKQETLIFVFIYTVLALLVITGNSLIMIAYKRNPKLRTPTSLFFVSLAASDLLVGTVSIPSWMYILLYDLNNPFPNPANMRFRTAYTFLDVFSALTSIAHLVAVTIERGIAISKPLKHRVIPRRYYYVAIAATWSFGLLTAIVFVADFKSTTWRKYRGLFSTVAGFIVPICVITYMYADIYRRVKVFNTRQRRYRLNSPNKRYQEKTAAKTVFIITSLFLLSWLPFFTLSMLYILCPAKCLPRGEDLMHLVDFVKLLQYGNSAINPVVYALRSSEIRATLSRIVAPCIIQLKVTASSPRNVPLTAGSALVPVNGQQ
ncbi:adenosine receptor A1-like [Montipora foliosa]|uniref:adenosine receptor A1-like n=1 Tax=Montipora foliosa TaxID=591990 RepID=UPI0035F12E69